jgi:tRNA dimethylallyltransferase
MQMYDGLPIITNKITSEEQKSIPHHLLGIVGLDKEPWRVGLFKKKARSVIKEIRARGKLPILVGGTHYYTQSLLFEDVLISDAAHGEEETGEELSREELNRRFPILERPTEEILERLRTVDPVMADRWHPNDRRKIQRSLEIYLMTGKPASKAYEEQQERKHLYRGDASNIEVPAEAEISPLLESTLIFWVHADPEVLSKRLDERVEKMLKVGLINEVETLDKFLHEQTAAGVSVDRSSGIWVSIGFKEFEPYIEARKSNEMSSTELQALFAAVVERTKAATRQYAKRQIRWIRLKLLTALSKANSLTNTYLLDGSNLDHWSASVSGAAIDIVHKFLAKEELPAPHGMSQAATELLTPKRTFDLSDRRGLWIRHTCELCNMTAVTDEQWQRHIKGRGHRRAVKKASKNTSHGRSQGQSNDITAEIEPH